MKKDTWDDKINLPYHFANWIICIQNMLTEGLTTLFLIIPGLFASISLIILSPLYKYSEMSQKEALSIGKKGIKIIPKRVLIGILLIIMSPVGYFINNYTKKKETKMYTRPTFKPVQVYSDNVINHSVPNII